MQPIYDYVTFDCYGTLIDWKTGIAAAFVQAAARDGVSLEPAAVLTSYARTEPIVEAGEYRPYREVLRETALSVAQRHGWNLDQAQADFLPRSLADWPPFDDTRPALERLRSAGYRIGILSNVDLDLLQQTLDRLDIEFDFYVTAQQVRAYCLRGDYNLCELGGAMVIGNGMDGGMADELIVPARCLVPLPSGTALCDACLVEPLAVAAHGLRRAGLRGDQRVAVIGGGSMGLCAVAVAAASGAEVALAARHERQSEAGLRLGATALLGSYDIVVDAAGTKSALDQAVEACRPGGSLLLVGTYWDGFELSGIQLCMKEIDVVPASMYARHGVARDIDVAAGILASNPEIGDSLITHRFPLDAASEAFRVAGERAAGAIKVVLEPYQPAEEPRTGDRGGSFRRL